MSERCAKTVLLVSGMRANSCRECVARAIGRVAGVRDVSVSLLRGRAIVTHGAACSVQVLIRAVESAGFGAELREEHPGRVSS